MGRFAGLLALGLVVTVGAGADARAQAVAAGLVYAVTYVEVMPPAVVDGVGLLARYRDATRRQDGNMRCEVVQRIGQPHQLVVLEVWKDRTTFEGHGGAAGTAETRARLASLRIAPADERVHGALSVAEPEAPPPRDAVYVVTHVDVVPPRKDDGAAALRRLGESSRTADGNLRFEVVQQTSRPNHFTIVEVWRDAKAVEVHSMAAATREFRDALAPMTGRSLRPADVPGDRPTTLMEGGHPGAPGGASATPRALDGPPGASSRR
jgi:quinol monooxygenase YgiN